MGHLDTIKSLFDKFKQMSGRDPRHGGFAIITASEGAVMLMRELLFKPTTKVDFNTTDDSLFRYDHVPIYLRARFPPGDWHIAQIHDVPSPTCCDITAQNMLWLMLGKSRA